MKKSTFKTVILIIAAAIILSSLCSCSAEGKSDSYSNQNGSYDSPSETLPEKGDGTEGGENVLPSEESTALTNRKLIRKIHLRLQTKDFDSLIDSINRSISESGGYIENSSIDGKDTERNNSRSAHIVARIPTDKSDSFVSSLSGENTNLLSRTENTEDVTLSYVDTESRLSSLRSQKQALEALYEKAETISEINYVQKELYAVIREIESYEATLRQLENMVSFSTLTLDIHEVKVYTVVDESDPTFGEEIKNGFTNSLSNVAAFFKGMTVLVITLLPYLLIILPLPCAVLIILLIVTKIKKKKQ